MNDHAAAVEVRRERESTRQGERMTLAQKTVHNMKTKQLALLRETKKAKFAAAVKMHEEYLQTEEKSMRKEPMITEIIEEQNEQDSDEETAGVGKLRTTRGLKP